MLLAVLVAAALGLALVPGVHATRAHAHPARGIAVLASVGADNGHAAARADTHGTPTSVLAAVRPGIGGTGTSDPCTTVRSRSAHAPQVRGPPAQSPA